MPEPGAKQGPAGSQQAAFKKRLSLRTKISTWATILILLTVISTGLVVLDRGRRAITSEMIERGRAMAANLATFSEGSLSKDMELKQSMDLTTQAYDLAKGAGVLYAVVVDRRGRVIAHSDTRQEGTPYVPPRGVSQLDPDSPDAGLYIKDGVEIIDIARDVTLRGRAKLGAIHLGLSRAVIEEVVRESFLQGLIVAASLIVVALIGTNLLVGWILKPVNALAEGAAAIGGGDLTTVIEVKSRDELGQLAATFNDMTLSLKNAQKDLVAKERMEQELAIAQQIQSRLVPDEPPVLPNFELASRYRPAVEVGGDYYDFLQPARQEHGILIADVSGKGVPASMGMTIARFALRAMAPHSNTPSDLLKRVNAWLNKEFQEGMFVTVFYMLINEKNHELLFANGGHNPLLHYRASDGAVLAVRSKGMAVGMVESKGFDAALQEGYLKVAAGDMVLLYTDGLSEAINDKREEFGDAELPQAVKELGSLSPEEFLSQLDARLQKFTAGLPQFDDVTMIALKAK